MKRSDESFSERAGITKVDLGGEVRVTSGQVPKIRICDLHEDA